MKELLLFIAIIFTKTGIRVSILIVIINFLLYLFKDKHFGWWAIWLFVIFVIMHYVLVYFLIKDDK